MITNKENWINLKMEIIDTRLVEDYMREYRLSEVDARRRLAEMYYDTYLYNEK